MIHEEHRVAQVCEVCGNRSALCGPTDPYAHDQNDASKARALADGWQPRELDDATGLAAAGLPEALAAAAAKATNRFAELDWLLCPPCAVTYGPWLKPWTGPEPRP